MPLSVTTDPADPACVLLLVKAVPGAKRDEVAGVLGERLKVRVSAPPEGGKANEAICRVVAEALSGGVRARDVEVVRGHTSAEKTLRIRGVNADSVRKTLDR